MSGLKKYLVSDYPPAVTTVSCTALFALYVLVTAVVYEFVDAPDHSMPSDYNRLLHNLSTYDLCESSFSPPNTSTYSEVHLLTKIHGKEEVVNKDTSHTVYITDKVTGAVYYVETDSEWDKISCEKGECTAEKCVRVAAPSQYFPEYVLAKAKQCEQDLRNTTSPISLVNCDRTNDRPDMKVDFKRRNSYAKSLSPAKKQEMQRRLVEIGGSLLLLNIILLIGAVYNAKCNRNIDISC